MDTMAEPTNEPVKEPKTDKQVVEEKFSGGMCFMVTLMRAIESACDDHICYDPYADALTQKARPLLMPLLEKMKETEKRPHNYMAIRTRYHDEALKNRNPEIRQVVLLGAGFDARPFYLEALRGCHVLEIDDSAPIFEHKDDVLKEQGAQLVAAKDNHIVANLLEPGWEKHLFANGFDPKLPTFWSMEGLLPYFTREQNITLLRTLDSLSAPGSEMWVEMVGEVKNAAGELMKSVKDLKNEEGGERKSLLVYGEEDPLHGVMSEIPWKLTVHGSLTEPGVHFGREWETFSHEDSAELFAMNFMLGKKTTA